MAVILLGTVGGPGVLGRGFMKTAYYQQAQLVQVNSQRDRFVVGIICTPATTVTGPLLLSFKKEATIQASRIWG